MCATKENFFTDFSPVVEPDWVLIIEIGYPKKRLAPFLLSYVRYEKNGD
jgi:hypothetical protein